MVSDLAQLITDWQSPDDPRTYIHGWCVVIVGTVRCSYLSEDLEPTYKESRALICATKDGASQAMNAWAVKDKEIWRYMRLIPCVYDRKTLEPYHGTGLPTVNGY